MKILSIVSAGLLATAMTGALVATASAQSAMPPELTDAMAGKFKGAKVTAFGAFAGADEVKFNENVKAFEAATGIDIQYESSKQFEATISTRVDAGFRCGGLQGSDELGRTDQAAGTDHL
jgi:alpha-glucoside transport system substrate-binding protein